MINKGLIGPVGGIGDIGLVKDVRRDTGTKAEVPSARMDLSAAASVYLDQCPQCSHNCRSPIRTLSSDVTVIRVRAVRLGVKAKPRSNCVGWKPVDVQRHNPSYNLVPLRQTRSWKQMYNACEGRGKCSRQPQLLPSSFSPRP